MKKYRILYVIFFVVMAFCLSCQDSIPKEELIENRVICDASLKMEELYGFKFVGFGHGLDTLSITFESYIPMLVDDAREVIVNCCKIFLETINNDEELRPFLKKYPWDITNIKLRIGGRDKEGKPVSAPYIVYMSIINGVIRYYFNENPTYELHLKETYEEAVAKCKCP